MHLTKVTLTGADDSIDPEDILNISILHPHVEWGILLSRSQQGGPRFPSKKWLAHLLDRLRTMNEDDRESVHLSAHLCGGYVREALVGDVRFLAEIGDIWTHFERCQLNTHAIPHEFNAPAFVDAFTRPQVGRRETIFQEDGVNGHILHAVRGALPVACLFDLSHGAGVLPDRWPDPLPGVPCGYAGGLGPENLEAQLKRIEHATSVSPNFGVWVDMETKLRSLCEGVGDEFDLAICQSVIDITEPWTKTQQHESKV